VKIDLNVLTLASPGVVTERITQTLHITDGFYARADMSVLGTLGENEQLTYTLTGYDEDDSVVERHESEGLIPWPAVCRETCDSGWWAWSLTTYSDNALAVINLDRGMAGGSPYFVYCKAGDDWTHFKTQFPSPWEFFGIGEDNWSPVETGMYGNYATDLRRLEAHMVPEGARAYNNVPLGPVSAPTRVMAVKKGLGPWRRLAMNPTNEISLDGMCLSGTGALRTIYNARPETIQRLETYDLDPLMCGGMLNPGGGTTWGGGYDCTTYVFYETDPGIGFLDVGTFSVSTIGCVILIDEDNGPMLPHILGFSTGVTISRFEEDRVTHKLNIPFPSETDPKLIPVPKTILEPGLYEFLFVLQDGRMVSRFLEFTVPTTLKADYASFTNVNVYPVPVNDKVFAIDMDLALPTAVSIQIVNGQGTTYYTTDLVFELAGRNKHVVDMAQPWPNGLYHAILTYQDGSSTTRSLIVNIE